MRRVALLACVLTAAIVAGLSAQGGVDEKKLLNPGTDSWPGYNGDYTGRRFSPLDRINASNIKALSLAWVYRLNPGTPNANVGSIKGTPVLVDGVMYVTAPDHVWALDARTGRERWHHAWQSKGGIHIGNRGVGILGDTLYYQTPDCNLVALNVKDGVERWHKQVCDLDQFYYGSVAPVIVKNHVIAGVSGDDLDVPGYVQAHDPVTGEMQWRWWVVPQKKGDPGSDTWPNEEAMQHGGGMTWQPPTYDPELNLVYVTTGNPQPVIAHANRAGDNLFTASIVALNPDTGKMVWYFQSSPHDTHDWDATQTPVLIDGEINGQPRKLLAQASRNGKFFVLDRATGKAIVSSDFVRTNWSTGFDAKGQPIPEPGKAPPARWHARLSQPGWRSELAAAELQPADRAVLRQCEPGLQRLLHLRSGRKSAGLGRHGSRRLLGSHAAGDRLQDRQNQVEPSVGGRLTRGTSEHRGQSPLQRRRVERPRRAERDNRRGALACRSECLGLERPDHVRDGRQTVCRRRRR